jgi:putative methyltransferase (TIGR04325 family)
MPKATIKNALRSLCPPVLWTVARRLRRRGPRPEDLIRFTGDYATWEDAQRASGGYAAAEILERTQAAMRKVRDGEAAFERDSVVFAGMCYEFPLLAALLRVASLHEGRLSVLDFGGALGSTYYHTRTFLTGVRRLCWSVVEQPAHVACGRAEFANEQLRFFDSIDACCGEEAPNVFLLSAVVHYLPKPYEFIADVARRRFAHLIVDRTPFMRDGRTLLTIEHVPDWIYRASYPSWFLSEQRFLEPLQRDYRLIASFSAIDTLQPEHGEADYKGYIFDLAQDATLPTPSGKGPTNPENPA